ncbi:hypothetical protein E3N88_43385 [Mikania micrantha]|uniref:Major facilitator superfamily (MFS) profile domain-containing protein n=1 Tax=Mikania micrantha TaxID=192012 RepID=A0A5N6LF32_9ASTR|nr:hypothetical protein E3N88_43385 [Mikania micrantha]
MEEKGYTQDGTVNLRKQPVLSSKTGKWKACAFLVGYEAFERMAFYGVASNLVVYLTTQLHEDTVASVRNVNNWSGAVWMTPIFGAYIADSYLGRFWTFTVSSLIYVLGMVLLTLAVSIKFLKPTCNNGICNKASTSQIAFFYTSLYIIAIGAGGTKPNISTFGADQFDDFNPDEKRLKVSFFNWWMFSSFLGALVATLGLVYIQENLGWGLGYGIPTVGLILSLLIFYIGTPMYRHKVRKTKSPTRDFFRVVRAAVANRHRELPQDPAVLHEFVLQHYVDSGKRQVYHTPNFSTIWAQVNTLFVKQGTTLDRHLGSSFQLPAASLGSFVTLSMLISSPEDMQSLGTTFFTSGIGVGNFLNSFLVTMVDKVTSMDGKKSWIGKNLNDSHLDYYYGFLFLISVLNLGAFVWASKKYIYKRESNVEAKIESLEMMECKTLEGVTLGLQV